jgi:hypothetical protein
MEETHWMGLKNKSSNPFVSGGDVSYTPVSRIAGTKIGQLIQYRGLIDNQ